MLVNVQSTFQFRVMRGLELTPAVTETDTPMTHLELPFNLKHACLWMSGDTRSTQSHREHRNSARKSQSLMDSNPGTCSVRHQSQSLHHQPLVLGSHVSFIYLKIWGSCFTDSHWQYVPSLGISCIFAWLTLSVILTVLRGNLEITTNIKLVMSVSKVGQWCPLVVKK